MKLISKRSLPKRFIWLAFFVSVLALAGLVYWKYNGREHSDEKFSLNSEAGKSSYRTAGGQYQLNSEGKVSLENHSLVKTTDTGALVSVANFAKVFLEKNTEIQVNIYKSGVTIRQMSGKVSYRVNEANKKGRYFYVRTPASVIKEQGTWYTIEIYGNTITCDVEEGSVYSVVIDRVYEHWDPNGPEVQPIQWRSISPVRINIYPDGSWGFGTIDYDPTPGAINRYNYDGTRVNTGERGTVTVTSGGQRGRTEVSAQGRTPQTTEIRNRYGREMDAVEERLLRGEISEAEANRLIGEIYNRMRQELAAVAGVDVLDRPLPRTVTSCSELRAHTIPSGLAAAARYRAAAAQAQFAPDVIPRGIDYYENFLRHVCDDDRVDGTEQQYINEIAAWGGN